MKKCSSLGGKNVTVTYIYIYTCVCYFSGLFTTVYVNVIYGKLLYTLAVTALYFSGTVADCPFACKCN